MLIDGGRRLVQPVTTCPLERVPQGRAEQIHEIPLPSTGDKESQSLESTGQKKEIQKSSLGTTSKGKIQESGRQQQIEEDS